MNESIIHEQILDALENDTIDFELINNLLIELKNESYSKGYDAGYDACKKEL